jgi:AraC family transcriptional regulator, transcriptional activator FtrA
MLKKLAVVILDGFTPFELGVICEVFGVDRQDDGLPA